MTEPSWVWKEAAEVIGVLGIIAGIIFLGYEMRQNTVAVRSAAVNDANVSLQAWYLGLSNNRQMSEVWLDGLLSTEPLETDDEYQFTLTTHAAFLAFQNSYLLAREGSLDEEILGSITAALLPTKDLPGMRRYWRQRRGYFFPEFAQYIDDLFSGEETSDAVDVFRDASAAQ